MMKSMPDAMITIDEQLVRLQRPTVQLLNPGTSAEETCRCLEARGLHFGRELGALYSWHDGTAVSPGVVLDDAHLVPGYYLMSVHEALTTFDELKDLNVNHAWLPILTNGGGDFAFVDCSDPDVQPIFDFSFEQDVHKVQYMSIGDMLGTFAEAYERGIFFLEDGWLEMDDRAYWELARSLNPQADYWALATGS